MTKPVVIDIPHRLGRDTARQRLRDRIGDLPRHVPGGMAEIETSWPGADRMLLEVRALGQSVTATIDVEERLVRASFVLPALLSFMRPAIEAAVRKAGSQALLPGPEAAD